MHNSIHRKILLGLCIATILISSTSTHAAPAPQSRTYGIGNPFKLEDLPPGLLRNQLKALPPQARDTAMSKLGSLHFHSHDVPYMRADKDGGIYYADTYLPQASRDADITGVSGTAGTAAITAADAFKLHSKPGSSKIIYLDFDGHTITGTAWNSNGNTFNALPYDLDNIPGSFNDTEIARIAEIWRRIAEDYAPFDVDVTTEQPTSFGPTVGRLLITKNVDANGQAMPSSTAGGVAYVGVWGQSNYHTTYSPALVYYNNLGGGRADYVTEAASHEMGHNMGLSHDGTSTLGYYNGHGTGFTSWGPIMGTGYNRNVSQWSKGEYPDANMTQDDISLIAGKVSLRVDDHADQRSTATPLVVDASGNIISTTLVDDPANLNAVNKGIVGTRTDVDIFSFSTSGGLVSLQATPAREAANTRGGNLDIQLSLYDQFGNLITSDQPVDDTHAAISTTLGAGSYYLAVEGVGRAAVGTDYGYNDYGSIGRYSINGSLPQNTDTNPPTPNPMDWASLPVALDHQRISMTAVTATDDVSSVQYYFDCVSGGTGCTDSGWVANPSFTATGLAAATTYTYQVKARDAFGNETAASATASATTATAPVVNQPPRAVADSATVTRNTTVLIPVLSNDSDPENDTLTVTAISRATKGTATITTDKKQVSYKAGRKTGSETLTYTISDGKGNTATGNITVTIK